MSHLKEKLLVELRKIPGIQDRPSPVSGGTALFYSGKEFAHFHDDNELDLKLTKGRIHALGLSHPSGSIHHPARSPNSPWIEIRFKDEADIMILDKLVRIAVAEL